jgi:hypothetical protein
MLLTVYVPAGEDTHGIDPGSAIVGSRIEGADALLIDYEGGRFGQMGFEVFENRLLHAAGRHVQRYPTRARQRVDPRAFRAVGTYDSDTRELDVGDPEALEAWVALYQR